MPWLILMCALAADPRAQLYEARHRFELGDFAATRALLRPLVDQDSFGEAADRNEALRLYGVACFLEGLRGDAEGAFTALLVHDPAARLDRVLYPPDVVAFFDAIRSRREAELAQAVRGAPPRKHLILAVLPFGIAQFQNQHRRKAWLLLSAETVLVAGATTTYLLLKSDEQPGHTFADPERANTLRNLNLICGATLAATAVYGLIDGLYYYRKGEPPPSLSPRAALLPLSSGGLIASVRWGF
ncbi:MAG TPA: hypothetical protein VKN99_24480 [Polyangia bacterium]|nr:hypothetical protein [Polyangia bacterium]